MGIFRSGGAHAAAPGDTQVTVSVFPDSSQPGDLIRLEARGLPAYRQVEAGLRTQDGFREVVTFYWTDSRGSLKAAIPLPNTAEPGETWLGVVRVPAVEVDPYLSKNTIRVTAGPFTYRVRQGDTLGVIAGWFHTRIEDILDLNPEVKRANRVYVGQSLVIPVGSAIKPSLAFTQGYRIPDFEGVDWRQSVVRGVLGVVWEEIQEERRWIDVDLSSQTARAYQGTKMLRRFIVSTGRARTPTVTGKYHIYVKHRYTHMSGPGYHLEDVPFTMYFYKGYGLHGTYWHNNFGRPMSHGCVNLRTEDAEWLFAFASVGTLVHVHR
jgi:lipoprotein-anchoring transpeptidase ErfK/SrfK